MPSYRLDGSRVAQLLSRLQQIEKTYQATSEELAEAERTGRMNKWKTKLALAYHRGLWEATTNARLTLAEEFDEDLIETLSGPCTAYGTGTVLTRALDTASDLELSASDLREALACVHEMVEDDRPDGGISQHCENCGLEPEVLDELGIDYDGVTPCRICGARGGDGQVLDREGDYVPCYECTGAA